MKEEILSYFAIFILFRHYPKMCMTCSPTILRKKAIFSQIFSNLFLFMLKNACGLKIQKEGPGGFRTFFSGMVHWKSKELNRFWAKLHFYRQVFLKNFLGGSCFIPLSSRVHLCAHSCFSCLHWVSPRLMRD